MRRATDRGWSVVFTPEARCVHVGGASHGGRCSGRTSAGTCATSRSTAGPGRPSVRAGACCGPRSPCGGASTAVIAGGSIVRGRSLARLGRCRVVADELCAAPAIERSGGPMNGVWLCLRLVVGFGVVLAPGVIVARPRRPRARFRRGRVVARARVRGPCSDVRLGGVARPGYSRSCSSRGRRSRCRSGEAAGTCLSPRPRVDASRRARCSVSCSGGSPGTSAATASSTSRASSKASCLTTSSNSANEFPDGGLHPGYAFPALARVPGPRRQGVGRRSH